MVEHVEISLRELRAGLADLNVRTKEDGSGGAFVIVDDVEIGDHFAPPRSWIGFHLTWAEDADVYPHFLDPAVRYTGPADGAPNQHADGNLPAAMSRDASMPGFEIRAIQVSRKSNHRDAETDSPTMKLLRIISFLRSR